MRDTSEAIIADIHQARRLALSGQAGPVLAMLDTLGDLDFATFHIIRGECFYSLRQFDAACAEFRLALKLAPNSPRAEIMLELAGEMVELGKSVRRSADMTSLIGEVNAPTFSISDKLKEYSQNETQRDVQKSDEIGLVSETLASIMIRQGKFEEARKVYIQLARLNPDRYDYFRERMDELEERLSA